MVIGKIEDIKLSKDGKVRKVIIGYKYDTIQGERDFRVVERPVGECVRLLNVEDASIFEDTRAVRDACKEILGDEELSTTPSVRGRHEREMGLANEESDEIFHDKL